MNTYIDDDTGEVGFEEPKLGWIIVSLWGIGSAFPVGLMLSMAAGWYSV